MNKKQQKQGIAQALDHINDIPTIKATLVVSGVVDRGMSDGRIDEGCGVGAGIDAAAEQAVAAGAD